MKKNDATYRTLDRCVHCLRVSEELTRDHAFPNSWYPDTTPKSVQRWTAPSCLRCNNELGRFEEDLLLRVVLCIDPRMPAVAGVAARALRSLGLRTEGISTPEKVHRGNLRSKFSAALIPFERVRVWPGTMPGLGPR